MLAARLRCYAVALLLLTPASAAAQAKPDPSLAGRQDLARTKAEQGLKLFSTDRWQDAYDRFREADQLYHAPTLMLYMARCQRKLGKLIEARGLYEQLLSEELSKDAPAAFVEARTNGKSELVALRERIPAVQIVVTGVPSGKAHVTLDGAKVATYEEKQELNPGNHKIEATADGGEHVGMSFTLTEGTTQKVELALGLRSTAKAAAVPAPSASPASSAPPRDAGGSFLPASIAFGVGAVGLGVGAVTGILSLGKVHDIKKRCIGNDCPTSDKEKADAARALGNVSTAGFIAGGAGVATGVVLLALRRGKSEERPTSASPASSEAPGITFRAAVGLFSIDLEGKF
jgi:hypothetical protein